MFFYKCWVHYVNHLIINTDVCWLLIFKLQLWNRLRRRTLLRAEFSWCATSNRVERILCTLLLWCIAVNDVVYFSFQQNDIKFLTLTFNFHDSFGDLVTNPLSILPNVRWDCAADDNFEEVTDGWLFTLSTEVLSKFFILFSL